MEKITKAVLSAGIPLYKLNKLNKCLYHDIDHSLPSKTAYRKSAAIKRRRVAANKNAVHDNQSINQSFYFIFAQ